MKKVAAIIMCIINTAIPSLYGQNIFAAEKIGKNIYMMSVPDNYNPSDTYSTYAASDEDLDLNGDGKKDDLATELSTNESDETEMVLYINGNKAAKVTTGDGTKKANSTTVYAFRRKNGKYILGVALHCYNGYPDVFNLYYVKGNRLVSKTKVIKQTKCDLGYIHDGYFDGKKMTLWITTMDRKALGVADIKYQYICKKNKFKLKSNVVIGGYETKSAKKLKVYNTKLCKKKSFNIKKNTRLRIAKVYIKNRKVRSLYIITNSNKKGWIKNSSGNKHSRAFVGY